VNRFAHLAAKVPPYHFRMVVIERKCEYTFPGVNGHLLLHSGRNPGPAVCPVSGKEDISPRTERVLFVLL